MRKRVVLLIVGLFSPIALVPFAGDAAAFDGCGSVGVASAHAQETKVTVFCNDGTRFDIKYAD